MISLLVQHIEPIILSNNPTLWHHAQPGIHNMNKHTLSYCRHCEPGGQALKAFENTVHHLLEQRRWPDDGWSDANIELLLQQLSAMDSNNFPG